MSAVCKHCGKSIVWAGYEWAPSVWLHVDTGFTPCYPLTFMATPDE